MSKEEINTILANRDENSVVTPHDHHDNRYKQVKAITFGGELLLDIVPDICPTGQYCCQSMMVHGDLYEYEGLCPHLVHFGNNELICGKMTKTTEYVADCFED